MTILSDGPDLRATVAQACRLLAARGMVEGALGHVSARVGEDEIVIRCRGPAERGLAHTRPDDVWRVRLDGEPVDVPTGYGLPKELPLHTELLRARPDVGAVVHAHPHSALLCTLADLQPRAVYGAFDIPGMRMARRGIPVYDRPVLIRRPDLAREMVEAMGDADVCLLKGHGVTVAGETVEQAAVRAVRLDTVLCVTVELARLGADPPELTERDLAEMPDLGMAFNDGLVWRTLVASLPG